MKILFMADGSHPETLGGIETFGRTLKKYFDKDLKFLTYRTKKQKYFKVKDIIEINEFPFFIKVLNKLFFNKIRVKVLKKEIEKINPDICLINHPYNIQCAKNTKKILIQHRNYDTYIPVYCNNDRKLIQKLEKELDYFIFLSKYDKEKFIKELNFPREKVKVIRHSCEIELLEGNKEKSKELIMIARLTNDHKRFDLAINAMKKLQDYKLKIYGDGPDREFLEKLIRKNNSNNVFLYDGTNQIKEMLDNAGIFIMTSDYEGYPISTIEAMRRGLPIILRNTFEATQDIVIDNGVLLDKEWNEDKFIEAVKKIYDNYDYYSKNSIELGKRHDFEVIKKQWRDLIDSLKDKK